MNDKSSVASSLPEPGDQLPWLREQLDDINAALISAGKLHAEDITAVAPEWTDNARNLIHYVTLRRRDLRPIQAGLSLHGFSSLGRVEPHVLPTINAIRNAARVVSEGTAEEPADPGLDTDADGVIDGPARLDTAAIRCFGPAPEDRYTRIMVTMPSEASHNRPLLRDLVAAGMNLIRVNCAHDDPETWESIIGLARSEAKRAERPVRVSMDLGGPKLRTGPFLPAPGVVKIKPTRDTYGRVLVPAYVWLGLTDQPGPAGIDLENLQATGFGDIAAEATVVPVTCTADLERRSLAPGSELRLIDARGSKRRLPILYRGAGGVLVSTAKTTYVTEGVGLHTDGAADSSLTIAALPAMEQALRLHEGETLQLLRTTDPQPVTPIGPARVGCTLPEVFDAVEPGERVLFDDGSIEGTAVLVSTDRIDVRIDRTAPGGSKLKAEKGINVPDTELPVSALTDKDRRDLKFVAKHADIVNVSFVNTAEDVQEVIDLLRDSPAADRDFGMVLKIETLRAFRNLPQILLAAMRWPSVGVMIARGDLAVEIGFERMAEVQQEILWLCESAGVPVIWATQVLEQLAKKGLPTRAEVTDAAEAQQAEVVMLNKGPFIVTAVSTLADILQRMQTHTEKKISLLRRLESWDLGRTG